ncbi:unnamed protein product, partial [Tetraodon nigroviridis]
LESSIQNLLSVLYPPFEATAPTLLSQLFQIIEGRYEGDALRCLLDFLVPAKHILDTVQQAACAQYSDVLFLCEGWPLCLHDRVVVHFAPIDPSLLQPGDFYLRVAPFCDQSARILVCSLLEEEGLLLEVVEETPIPETSYPCLFTRDWLEEINQGRHGTPLRRCLLAAQQGTTGGVRRSPRLWWTPRRGASWSWWKVRISGGEKTPSRAQRFLSCTWSSVRTARLSDWSRQRSAGGRRWLQLRHRDPGSLPPHTPGLTTCPWGPRTPEPTLCIWEWQLSQVMLKHSQSLYFCKWN